MHIPTNDASLTIYLIEDNPIDIFIVQQMVELEFPQGSLITFPSTRQALEEFNQGKVPDHSPAQILLVDLDMPLLNGWEFLESYEKSAFYKRKSSPAYILTASINPKDVDKSKAFRSVAGFFSKPLTEEHIQRIKTHVNP